MSQTKHARAGGPAKPERGPTQRQLRVGEELRHALARILSRGDLRDPALSDVNVTVTEVRLSPDMKNATAFVVPLGGGRLDRVVAALNHAAGFLRTRLGHEVQLRYLPRLSFEADRSFDEATRVEEILKRPSVRRDLTDGPATPAEGGDGDGA